MTKNSNKLHIAKILSISLLAAAWIIAGPDWLSKLGLQNAKAIDLLTLIPALMVMFSVVRTRPDFLTCERRTFKRILGLK